MKKFIITAMFATSFIVLSENDDIQTFIKKQVEQPLIEAIETESTDPIYECLEPLRHQIIQPQIFDLYTTTQKADMVVETVLNKLEWVQQNPALLKTIVNSLGESPNSEQLESMIPIISAFSLPKTSAEVEKIVRNYIDEKNNLFEQKHHVSEDLKDQSKKKIEFIFKEVKKALAFSYDTFRPAFFGFYQSWIIVTGLSAVAFFGTYYVVKNYIDNKKIEEEQTQQQS